MINITIIRHGTTDLNGKGYIGTKKDFPLNANGIMQCLESKYNIGTFDNVYCSPYIRTIQTANIVYPYKAPIISNLITQRDMGVLNEHFKTEYNVSYLKKVREYLINPANAESLDDVKKRLNLFFEILSNENYENSNILIVTHNGIMRIIKKEILNYAEYEDTNNLGGFSMKLKK